MNAGVDEEIQTPLRARMKPKFHSRYETKTYTNFSINRMQGWRNTPY